MKKINIIIVLVVIVIFNQQSLSASDFDSYTYTNKKQKDGITYEVTNAIMNQDGLLLEGWGYISDTQHYINPSDMQMNIMVYETGGKKMFFPATITTGYDLTETEKFVGIRMCEANEYNQESHVCNYFYNTVKFRVQIPKEIFVYPNSYTFYMYINAKNANQKLYTQMYAPGFISTHEEQNYTYEFKSDLDTSNMVVNNDEVLVRDEPYKTSSIFTYEGFKHYFKRNTTLHPNNKFFDGTVTWYRAPIISTAERWGSYRLAAGNTNPNHGSKYIASIFADNNGSGFAEVTVKSNADFKLNKIYAPTISDESFSVGYSIVGNNILDNVRSKVIIQYGSYNQQEIIYLNNNQEITGEFLIDKTLINENTPITITIVNEDNRVGDKDATNNSITINPIYAENKTLDINLDNNDGNIEYDVTSGLEKEINGNQKLYSEHIKINIQKPVDKIQNSINQYDASFEKFYAGAIFEYPFAIDYTNDYPYTKYNLKQPTANMNISCQILDVENCQDENQLDYELVDQYYQLPKMYINEQSIISQNQMQDAIYPDGKRVVYTKLDSPKGKNNFIININSIGTSKTNFKINSFVDVYGKIFGKGKENLFYIRNMSSQNLMPNFITNLWKNNLDKLETINETEFNPTEKLEISGVAKDKIEKWISSDYQNNLNKNIQFDELKNKLIEEKEIIIK